MWNIKALWQIVLKIMRGNHLVYQQTDRTDWPSERPTNRPTLATQFYAPFSNGGGDIIKSAAWRMNFIDILWKWATCIYMYMYRNWKLANIRYSTRMFLLSRCHLHAWQVRVAVAKKPSSSTWRLARVAVRRELPSNTNTDCSSETFTQNGPPDFSKSSVQPL